MIVVYNSRNSRNVLLMLLVSLCVTLCEMYFSNSVILSVFCSFTTFLYICVLLLCEQTSVFNCFCDICIPSGVGFIRGRISSL